MNEQLQKALNDRDLVTGFISGVVAAIIFSYVANVAKPGIIHLLLALIGICGIIAAYVLIARSKVDPGWKTGTIIGVGMLSAIYLVLLSQL